MQLEFKRVNGVDYPESVDPEVIRVLEAARTHGVRVRLDFGDNGKSISLDAPVEGYIGAFPSTLDTRLTVPVLLANSRSTSGGPIDVGSLVRIWAITEGKCLWSHPGYVPMCEWEKAEVHEEGGDYAVKAPKNGRLCTIFTVGARPIAMRRITKKQRYEAASKPPIFKVVNSGSTYALVACQ